jgi:hypothetical protein
LPDKGPREYYPSMTHSLARRTDVIVATLACAIMAGCGTTRPRQASVRKPDDKQRLPVYAAGKLIGYCRGDFSGSGPSVAFHAEFRRGSREATLCASRVGEGVRDALYKVAGSHGDDGARILRLLRVDSGPALKGRVVAIYTVRAKLVGFCVPSRSIGNFVCTEQGRRMSVYSLSARPLGYCTPNELLSGEGNLVCTQEVSVTAPAT